jgi:hypothetical protein
MAACGLPRQRGPAARVVTDAPQESESSRRAAAGVPAQAGLRAHTRAGRRAARASAAGRPAVRGAAAPGPPPALRPAVRDRRRAGQLGRAQGADAGPERAADRGARRGPSDRVPPLRGDHPARGVRRRRRDRVGHRHLGAARDRRPGGRRGRGRAARRRVRPEAARAADPDPDRPQPRGREPVAAAAQARRVRGPRVESRGSSAVGTERADQRRSQGRPAPDVARGPPARSGLGAHRVGGGERRDGAERADGGERGGGGPARRRAGRRAEPGRAGRPRRAGSRGHLGGVRPPAQADQPGQGDVPGPRRRAAGDQTGVHPLRGQDRPGDPPVPGRPGAQHAPVPRGRADQRVLAQAASRARAGLGAALGQPERRPRRRHHLPGRGRARRAGVGGQLRGARVARVDRAHRRAAAAHLRAHRHRRRLGHVLGRRAGAGPAAPHRARAPGRAGAAQGDRPHRHPDLGSDHPRPELRGDPQVGRAAVQGGRRGRARPGQLAVGRGQAAGPRPAGLHPERQEQDAGRAVQPAPGAGGPIEWAELDDPSLRPDGFTIRTVFDRLAERGDPFRTVLGPGQALPPIR